MSWMYRLGLAWGLVLVFFSGCQTRVLCEPETCLSPWACHNDTCLCPSPRLACKSACIDPQTDPSHCGACGQACPPGEICHQGLCRCPPSFDRCGSSACLSLLEHPLHCGSCGKACPPSTLCQEGQCVSACSPGLTACQGSCVSLDSHLSHCGRCGFPCPKGASCKDGRCFCPLGQTECRGECVSLSTDSKHCGTCDNACLSTCAQGECVSPRRVETLAGVLPFRDGPAPLALFRSPADLALDPAGNLYLADSGNHRLRKIDPQGNVITFAGVGLPGFLDGLAEQARFSHPQGLLLDPLGTFYLADYENHVIRVIR